MPSTKCMADALIQDVSASIARDESSLSSLRIPFNPTGISAATEIPRVLDSPSAVASELQEAINLASAKQAERMAAENTVSDLGSKISELGVKLESAPKGEKAAIKA